MPRCLATLTVGLLVSSLVPLGAAEPLPGDSAKFVEEFRKTCRDFHSELVTPERFVERIRFPTRGIDAFVVDTSEFECAGQYNVFGRPNYRQKKMFTAAGKEILFFGGYARHVSGDDFIVENSGVDCRIAGTHCHSVYRWKGEALVRVSTRDGEWNPGAKTSTISSSDETGAASSKSSSSILDRAQIEKVRSSPNTEVADHNGSQVLIDWSGGRIIYLRPKPSIAGTVRPGQVLFTGTLSLRDGAPGRGTAFVFRRGCPAAAYDVGGHLEGSTLLLSGAAPQRAPGGCEVVGYSASSVNATLVFEVLGDL